MGRRAAGSVGERELRVADDRVACKCDEGRLRAIPGPPMWLVSQTVERLDLAVLLAGHVGDGLAVDGVGALRSCRAAPPR